MTEQDKQQQQASRIAKFESQRFHRREAKVKVERCAALAVLFDEGADHVFTVRQLEGHELAIAQEARVRHNNIGAMLNSFRSMLSEDLAKQFADHLAIDDNPETATPATHYYRIALLKLGLVDPPLNESQIVLLATHAPVQFKQLSDHVALLTGQGAEIEIRGKQRPSTATPAS